MFRFRKRSRRTPGGFINNVEESWDELPMTKVRSAIDVQRKICIEIKKIKGAITKYDSDWRDSTIILFYNSLINRYRWKRM